MEPSVTFHKLIDQLFQVCKDGKVDNSTEVVGPDCRITEISGGQFDTYIIWYPYTDKKDTHRDWYTVTINSINGESSEFIGSVNDFGKSKEVFESILVMAGINKKV